MKFMRLQQYRTRAKLQEEVGDGDKDVWSTTNALSYVGCFSTLFPVFVEEASLATQGSYSTDFNIKTKAISV